MAYHVECRCGNNESITKEYQFKFSNNFRHVKEFKFECNNCAIINKATKEGKNANKKNNTM